MSGRIVLCAISAGAVAARFAVPMPDGLDAKGWSLLIVFLAALACLALQSAPMSVIFIGALAIGAGTGTITAAQALAGYSNNVLWLILIAFMFARAFVKTGLGRRIALMMIERLGTNSLRLGYCLSLTDLILAPITPSNTARAGAIVFPIALGLSRESGSYPGATAAKLGAFLLFTAHQANLVTSALFLTAMASNPLAVEFARQVAGVEISWGTWLTASCVPGLVSLGILPYFIYKRYPPELKDTTLARNYARDELRKLGPAGRSAFLLCFFSNLNSSLTHYSNGAAPIYYGSGYIERRDWWRLGFQISVVHLAVWLAIGLPWWRFLGIW